METSYYAKNIANGLAEMVENEVSIGVSDFENRLEAIEKNDFDDLEERIGELEDASKLDPHAEETLKQFMRGNQDRIESLESSIRDPQGLGIRVQNIELSVTKIEHLLKYAHEMTSGWGKGELLESVGSDQEYEEV